MAPASGRGSDSADAEEPQAAARPAPSLSGAVPDDLTELPLEDLFNLKIDDVYGAAKHTQKVTEAPSSVTIITSDDIRKFGYRNLADLLQSVRGLYVTYDRNYHYLGVRGFNRPGDYNSRVLLLIDGHRVNDNVYGQAPIGNDFPLDMGLVERVEVIRGPGSSLYGSNAFFAVINVITRRGTELKTAEVAGRAGSFDAFQGRLSYGKHLESGLDLVLSATGYASDGPTLHFKEFDDPSTNNGIARNRDGESFYSLFLHAAYGSFTLQAAYVARDKEIPTASFGTIFNDPGASTVDNRGFLDLKYEREVLGGLDVMARLYYDNYYYRGRYPFDLTADGGPPRVVNKDLTRSSFWGSELKLATEVIPRNRITLGAELNHDFQQDQKNFDLAVYLDDQRNTVRFGLYAQDEVKILESLLLSAGVRYDYYETFHGTINPRIALIASPIEKTTFKLLYGEAFRAPSAYELYYQDGGASQKSNPGLDPETIRSYEAVVEQYVGNSLRFSASAYHYEIRDLISLVTDPADGLLEFRNVDRADAEGLELEAEGKWAHGLRARASYAVQRAEDRETDRSLTNSPQHLVKLDLVAPLLDEKLFAGFEAQYTSRRKTLAGSFANDQLIFNLTLFGLNLLPGLDVSATIYNLLDTEYGDPGSEEHAEDVIFQDGRTFSFQLTYRFW